ncbi:MAG TPA: deoxyribodipyrimidine photo-lyase [Chitinophagaceae bacterium]|nr:deoxyribodipyrimidine photo-lyase [Chitinophagaceae bacterium]
MQEINIFWLRRDLRLQDNAGLFQALKSAKPVIPIFIFDKNILEGLENKTDRRVEFIHNTVVSLDKQLRSFGSSLTVFHCRPIEAFQDLVKKYSIQNVFANEDYEPYTTTRDEEISKFLKSRSIDFKNYKDHVIFEKAEILKPDGNPYKVFTPYSRAWKEKLKNTSTKSYQSEKFFSNFYRYSAEKIPSLEKIGFKKSGKEFPESTIDKAIIKNYDKVRNIPSQEGTSRLGMHLRFGTVSVRNLVSSAIKTNETYLNELIWREFFQMILWQFPGVGHGESFRKEFDQIKWRNNEAEFEKWCCGETGYPIVDAGMRELNETGFMHNRVRMIAASFLCKHLLIDWRWGEAYFAEKLLDFELASNNGNWQWVAGCGCDAAPYFRIFNPILQAKKFDPGNIYIRKWVPEFQDENYAKQIVDHEFARQRCLEVYKKALVQAGKL